MKKLLLSFAAAMLVAMGANAQRVCTAENLNELAPNAKVVSMPMLQDFTSMTPVISKKAPRRAASVAGTYIMETFDFPGEFAENATFTIEEETGTIKIATFNEKDSLVLEKDFEYNVKLTDFSNPGEICYGKYYQEESTIHIPMQVVYTSDTYGKVILSGCVRTEDLSSINYGADIVLGIDEDGCLFFDEEYATGIFSFLPYYAAQPYATWSYGLDAAAYLPNATLGSVETHIVSGTWGDWEKHTYDVYVEDYESEFVVHNFFGLCPISIRINDNKASIDCPVRVMARDYADEGAEEPDYIQIWQWNSDFSAVMNPGEITGNVFVEEDGSKIVEFYDTEYREAWTDENGEHEAGDYILTDRTKWFMVHSTYGEKGAIFWGEVRNVYLVIPAKKDSEGISDVKAETKNTKTYNLMGQQVNRSAAKGLLIRDGKKFMSK